MKTVYRWRCSARWSWGSCPNSYTASCDAVGEFVGTPEEASIDSKGHRPESHEPQIRLQEQRLEVVTKDIR